MPPINLALRLHNPRLTTQQIRLEPPRIQLKQHLPRLHAIAHILGAGSIVLPIATWLLGSLVLLATRRSGRAAA